MANRKRFLICVFLTLLTTACSDVEFEDYIREEPVTLDTTPPVITEPPPVIQPPIQRTFKTEEFIQGATIRPVDILFVVDNSPSMIEEQDEMGQRIQSFIGQLSNVDWRIGVTTTDVSNGSFGLQGELLDISGLNKKYISSSDPNYQSHFLKTVKREESDCIVNCASSNEQPLLASIYAMQKHQGDNSGFFRSNADLAIVILSDEDEMSSGPATATQPYEVMQAFQQTWRNTKRLKAYSLIIQPGDASCYQKNPNGHYGQTIDSLVRLTGGVSGSICSQNYAAPLAKIGESVRHLTQTIELSEEPDPKDVKIEFIPDLQQVSWYVDGKKIHFDNPPQEGTKIKVKYAKQSQDSQKKSKKKSDDDEGEDD